MKLPESTATTRSAGSRSSSAIESVRGSIPSGPVRSSYGTSRQRTRAGDRRARPRRCGSRCAAVGERGAHVGGGRGDVAEHPEVAPAGSRRSRRRPGPPARRGRPGRSARRGAWSTCSARSPSRRRGRRRRSAPRPAARRTRRRSPATTGRRRTGRSRRRTSPAARPMRRRARAAPPARPRAPRPATNTGRCAASQQGVRSAATASAAGRTAGEGRHRGGAWRSPGASAACTSSGRLSTTVRRCSTAVR